MNEKGIPGHAGLQVVVCRHCSGAGKSRFGAKFRNKPGSCTPLLRKAKPNRLFRMLLIDNWLKPVLGVKSLASFGNSAFLRLERCGHHKGIGNFE
jgi:hypothetical protein